MSRSQWFGVAQFVAGLTRGVRQLSQERERINALNVFPVPDGDTGTNMYLTASRALEEALANQGSLSTCTEAAARGALMGARGNSGVILSQFFRGFARGCAGRPELTPAQVAGAIRSATETAYRAVITPVEGTILSVGKGLARGAESVAARAASWREVVQAADRMGQEALARTPSQLPQLQKAGVVDAGGQGLLALFAGFVSLAQMDTDEPVQVAPAVEERPVPALEAVQIDAATPLTRSQGIVRSQVTFRYCTEFLLHGVKVPAEQLKAGLEPLGDSLLVVGDAAVTKIHVHTNHPGKALEIALQAGEELSAVHINNMSQQNEQAAELAQMVQSGQVGQERVGADGLAKPASLGPAPADSKSFVLPDPPASMARSTSTPGDPGIDRLTSSSEGGEWPRPTVASLTTVVAVAVGDGLRDILRSLGVTEVVGGGPTLNPSTQELLEAIERAPTQGVVVLPNNKNVMLAAKQAAHLSTKEVHVLESTSVAQGISTLLAFRPDLAAAENTQRMEERLSAVRTGAITYAVRETEADGQRVHAGDFLAVSEDQVVAGGPQLEEVARRLLSGLVVAKDQGVTIYVGDQADAGQTERVRQVAAELVPDGEVDVYPGGQPIYYFLIAVE